MKQLTKFYPRRRVFFFINGTITFYLVTIIPFLRILSLDIIILTKAQHNSDVLSLKNHFKELCIKECEKTELEFD